MENQEIKIIILALENFFHYITNINESFKTTFDEVKEIFCTFSSSYHLISKEGSHQNVYWLYPIFYLLNY